MLEGKNYVLSEKKGNKVLLKRFIEYKITGIGFFIGFFLLGLLLIFADFNGIRFYKYGIILISIGLLICILLLPLKIKLTQSKDELIIEKINSFWIKKKFKINKKEKPIILGVKIMSLPDSGRFVGNHLYNLRISYSGGVIKLHQPLVPEGYSHLSSPEQIKEIANFFKLPYKLID